MNEEIRKELARLRKENRLLKEFIKRNSSEREYKEYLTALKSKKRKTQSYEDRFLKEAKKLKIKTKIIKLMREYNKTIKIAKTKVKFPKITIKELEKQGFKPTAKNLRQLQSQLEDTIKKNESIEYPYEFLMSMYENIVFTMFKLQFDNNLISSAVLIRDGENFKIACDNGAGAEIYDILTLLYDTVANGDEQATRDLLYQLTQVIDNYIRG